MKDLQNQKDIEKAVLNGWCGGLNKKIAQLHYEEKLYRQAVRDYIEKYYNKLD